MNTIQLVMRRGAVWTVLLAAVCLLFGARVASAMCGDNVVDIGEQCDGTSDVACPGQCIPAGDPLQCRCPTCGDGVINQPSEDCDGADDSACPGLCGSAGYPNYCRCPYCGDNMVNGSEVCDGYDDSACPGHCTDACTCATCGDNVAEGSVEMCDGTDDSACPGDCIAPGDPLECRCPICGDGVVNAPGEVCDRHDDSACPNHCAYDCTCAVCGDNVKSTPVEACDGTDDALCPGACFPPGDPHECVCPLTLNKCASKKDKCVAKYFSGLLGCHWKAELKAFGPPDPACTDKYAFKFDGGPDPTRGCFEKLELPGHCFTEDDTTPFENAVNNFVLGVVNQLDPSYPSAIIDRCSATKKKCVIKLGYALLGCRAKYEAKNLPTDPVCLQKALDKFDGGLFPEKNCFTVAETKYGPCQTTGESATLEASVDHFMSDVACALDPNGPDCQ